MKPRFLFFFACFLNLIDNNAKSLDSCILLIIGFKNSPGGIGGAGLLEHLIYSFFVLIPLLAITPVFIRNLPLLLRSILAFGKAV